MQVSIVGIGDATLSNNVSALNTLGTFCVSDFDLRKDYGVMLLLRGFKRLKGKATVPKDPLSPADLHTIYTLVEFSDPKHHIIWIIILLAFHTLLQKSNFVSTSPDNQEHLLRVKDLALKNDT